MIQIDSVSKVFASRDSSDGVVAVQDLSLEIRENEFVTLLGPSGCGKTTLLRMIAGLSEPTSGSIIMNGEEVTGPSPTAAMVFQSFALMPWASVKRNVVFGLELRGEPKEEKERVAKQLISMIGLEGFESRYPHELSGGMQQRVGLARALAVDPDVLLLDEPFGSLDEQTKRLMQEELLRVWEEERKTAVFVTHSIDEAVFLADRVVVMSARPGRIAETVDVPFPRPRSRELDTDPEFVALKARLWAALASQISVDQGA